MLENLKRALGALAKPKITPASSDPGPARGAAEPPGSGGPGASIFDVPPGAARSPYAEGLRREMREGRERERELRERAFPPGPEPEALRAFGLAVAREVAEAQLVPAPGPRVHRIRSPAPGPYLPEVRRTRPLLEIALDYELEMPAEVRRALTDAALVLEAGRSAARARLLREILRRAEAAAPTPTQPPPTPPPAPTPRDV